MAPLGDRLVMAKSVNVKVVAKKGESIDRLIKRFVKKTKKEGILEEYREKMYYEKPSDRKRRIKNAQIRAAKRKLEEQQKNDRERKN